MKPKQKNHACVECQQPNSADRPNTRCIMCRPAYIRKYVAEYNRLHPHRRRKAIPRGIVVVLPPPVYDLDILCYRDHKARVIEERNAILQSAKEALAA